MSCNFSSYFSRNSSSEVKGTEQSGIGTIIHDDSVSLEEDDAVKRVGTGTNEEVDILLGVFNDRAGTISNSSIPIRIEKLNRTVQQSSKMNEKLSKPSGSRTYNYDENDDENEAYVMMNNSLTKSVLLLRKLLMCWLLMCLLSYR
jgi:hypothetical protein